MRGVQCPFMVQRCGLLWIVRKSGRQYQARRYAKGPARIARALSADTRSTSDSYLSVCSTRISCSARFLLALLRYVSPCALLSQDRCSAPPTETGKFRLHKFEQSIGEETYTITRDRRTLTLKSDFLFTDRGTKVPLTATLRAADDYTPQSFVIKGNTSRMSEIDTDVEISGASATIRQGKRDADRGCAARVLHHFRIRAGGHADGDDALLARRTARRRSWRRCPRAK